MLLTAFAEDRLTAPEFTTPFMQLFKHDTGRDSSAEYEVLQTLFGAADSYFPDAELGGPFREIGDDELRVAAHAALRALESNESA